MCAGCMELYNVRMRSCTESIGTHNNTSVPYTQRRHDGTYTGALRTNLHGRYAGAAVAAAAATAAQSRARKVHIFCALLGAGLGLGRWWMSTYNIQYVYVCTDGVISVEDRRSDIVIVFVILAEPHQLYYISTIIGTSPLRSSTSAAHAML